MPVTAFFAAGFRPFFSLLMLCAMLFMIGWGGILLFHIPLPLSVPPVYWHAHELLFGIVGAAIAGFLLTAVANWTGRPPVSGGLLMLLVGIWVAARIVFFIPVGVGLTGLVNCGFWLLLAIVIGREIMAANNRRNLKVVLILVGFLVLEILFFSGISSSSDITASSLHAGIMLGLLLITLIAGRITPAFSNNWLRSQGKEPCAENKTVLDAMVFGSMALLLPWSFYSSSFFIASLALFAACVQSARLLLWKGWMVQDNPLLMVLHIAYSFIPMGLLLLAASQFIEGVPVSAALHVMAIGGIMSMVVAVAARVMLGHTKRALEMPMAAKIAYLGIVGTVLVRVLAAFSLTMIPDLYMSLLGLSIVLWVGSWLVFSSYYLPIMLEPFFDKKLDKKLD